MLSFQCFVLISLVLLQVVCCESQARSPDVLLCRQCGHTVVAENEVVDIKSSLALTYKNATIFGPKGVLVQTFHNPEGIGFDVITASKAKLHVVGEAYEQFSWFPGFSWKIAVCPSCLAHLGWAFVQSSNHKDEDPVQKYRSPDDYSFTALILNRLIRESFADSLIMTPKVYQT